VSSKGKGAMSEEGGEKSALVPRLRFPDFDGIVPALPLAAVADFVSAKTSVDQITPAQYVSTENLLPDFGGLNQAVKLPSVSSVTSFRPNDVLVSNIRPYLRKVWQADIHGGASNDVLVVRATEPVGADYLAAILRSDLFIDYVMRGAKGVKMPRGEISMIQEFPVPCPCAREQQKIADCLSSLDELITAETRKLDALKTHKKGLMQQLFPREGETVPRLRFPEFREAGEWDTKRLDSIGRVIRGASPRPKDDPRYYGGPVPRLMVQDVTRDGKWVTPQIDSLTLEGAKLSRPCPAGTLTIVCSGTVGVISFLAVDACIHDGFLALVDIDESIATKDFLFHSLSTLREQFEKGATHGGVFTNLTTSGIELFEITCPSPTEQKRISDCLTAIDDLITAQSQNIDALKIHKKGLMQQLFPVLDEVVA